MSFKQSFTYLFFFYILLLGTTSCSANEQPGEEIVPPTPTTEAFVTPEAVIEEPAEEPAPVVETTLPIEEISYSCGTAEDVAIAENAAQTYQVTTAEIMDYYCQGVSFEYISLALETTVLADVPLATVMEMVQSGSTWEQIWQDLGVIFTECGTEEDQDMAQNIAATYGVAYEEVLGFFCQGFSFEEILLALETDAQTGTGAKEILMMRRDGKSWDDIWKDLGVID